MRRQENEDAGDKMYTDTNTRLVEGSNMLLALDDLVALALGRIDNAPVDQKPLPPLLTHFERILSRLYVCACTDTHTDANTGTDPGTDPDPDPDPDSDKQWTET
jgi:hypothetical protein